MRITIDQAIKKPTNLEELRCYNINTCICPVIHVGTYQTLLGEPCDEDDKNSWAEVMEYPENLVYEEGFDFKKWLGYIKDEANDILQSDIISTLKPYGIEWLQATGMWSPKYYNFENDQMDFDVYLSKDFDRIFHENMAKFRENPSLQEYIEDHYWSRSGFWSWMPKSMDEIESFEDEERCLSAYIMFCMLVEGKEEDMDGEFDYSYRIWEYLHENAKGEECCDWRCYADDDLVHFYTRHPTDFNELLWDIFYKVGHKWKNYEPKHRWKANPENDAERFICWATDQGYSLEDLRELCA